MNMIIITQTKKVPAIWKFAQLLGKFTGSFPAAQLHSYIIRSSKRDKIMSLENAKGKMTISPLGKVIHCSGVQNIYNAFSTIQGEIVCFLSKLMHLYQVGGSVSKNEQVVYLLWKNLPYTEMSWN